MPKRLQIPVSAEGDFYSLRFPKSVSPSLKAHEPLDVESHGVDGLLFFRQPNAPAYLAGDLSAMALGEVTSHLVAGMRTGKLWVSQGSVRKSLTFREGHVVFATSTEPFERLGKLLLKKQLLTPEALDAALAQVRQGHRLGQVLIRQGVLTSAQLYSAMTELVTDIVLSLYDWDAGQFLFCDRVQAAEQLKLPKRTKDILLEGELRAEKVNRWRRQYALSAMLFPGWKAPTQSWKSWVDAVGNGRELSELRTGFLGTDFSFYGEVHQLISEGLLRIEKVRGHTGERALVSVGTPKDMYQALIRLLCTALRNSGKDLTELQNFFLDPLPGMEDIFTGVALTEEGALDLDKVLSNASAQGTDNAEAMAYDALDSFVSFALFAAKNVLPENLAAILENDFKQIQEGRSQ